MHKYCRDLAQALNDAGYMAVSKDEEKQYPWKEGLEISFSMELVKERMWKPILEALEGMRSTEEQNTVMVGEVFEELNRIMADKGIHVPWPSEETMAEEQR